jgi:hypothetical protein
MDYINCTIIERFAKLKNKKKKTKPIDNKQKSERKVF